MARISIHFLVARTAKSGVTSWFWQPSKTLRDAGFEGAPLGKNEAAAIARAQALNLVVDQWKNGGDLPRLKARVDPGTLGSLIARYRREVLEGTRPDGSRRIAPSTARTYETGLKRLDLWAGKHPLQYVTRARVRALRDAIARPVDRGGIGQHAAHTTLKLGRQLFAFALDEELVDRNPFVNFGMEAPAPRGVIWSPPARELIVETAARLGFHSIALAIVLGYAIGQREQDILALTAAQYVAIPEHKMQPEDYATLSAAAPDGVPRGIRIRQRKTGAWIEVPVIGDVRRAVESAIDRARAAGSLTVLLDDTRAALYHGMAGQTRFQRDFADIRDAAASAALKGRQGDLAAEITTLQFRDLRRTCVVYLGELGLDAHLIAAITGHDIDETQRILKVYMPRTTGRAARAVAIASLRDAKEAAKETTKPSNMDAKIA